MKKKVGNSMGQEKKYMDEYIKEIKKVEELMSNNFDENSIRISVANRTEPSKIVTVS